MLYASITQHDISDYTCHGLIIINDRNRYNDYDGDTDYIGCVTIILLAWQKSYDWSLVSLKLLRLSLRVKGNATRRRLRRFVYRYILIILYDDVCTCVLWTTIVSVTAEQADRMREWYDKIVRLHETIISRHLIRYRCIHISFRV